MSEPGVESFAGSADRRYTFVGQLGSGGFGVVYQGRQENSVGFVRTVAIKLLHPDVPRPEDFERRLRDEARVLERLSHHAIVRVEDLVQLSGRWAVVMEFIEGVDLRDLLRRGPVPARPTCEIGREVASALQAAHQATDRVTGAPLSIVHRDIKPANIRLTRAGGVKVLDFGIARASFSDREALTQTVTFGSPGYLAPERFDKQDSPASDVYSLGAVLYECLTGEPLGQLRLNPRYHAEDAARAFDRLRDAPPGLAGLIRQMLEYEPGDRPEAGAVFRRLSEAMIDASGPWLAEWTLAQISPEASAARAGRIPLDPSSADTLPQPDPGSSGAIGGSPPERGSADPTLPLAREPSFTAGIESLDAEPAADDLTAPLSPGEAAPVPSAPDEAVTSPLLLPAGEPPSPPLPEPPPESLSVPAAVRPAPRRPQLAALGLLALGVGVGAWFMRGPGPPEPAPAEAAVEAPADAAPGAPSSAPSLAPAASPSLTAPESQPVEAPARTPLLLKADEKPTPPIATAPTPDPPREPAPAVEPAPAAPTTGSVNVTGGYESVRLIDARGARHAPDALPPGSYGLEVTFPNKITIYPDERVHVQAGQIVQVVCQEDRETCDVTP